MGDYGVMLLVGLSLVFCSCIFGRAKSLLFQMIV